MGCCTTKPEKPEKQPASVSYTNQTGGGVGGAGPSVNAQMPGQRVGGPYSRQQPGMQVSRATGEP